MLWTGINDISVCGEGEVWQLPIRHVPSTLCGKQWFRKIINQGYLVENTLIELELKLFSNLAACYLKLGYHSDTIKSCDEALIIDPQ